MLLGELVPRVPFPLVALPVGWWKGSAFLGDVRMIGGEVKAVQLVYVTPSGDAGVVVSHLAPGKSGRDDPYRLTEHLSSFVSHFDPAFLVGRAKRGRYVPFRAEEMEARDEIAIVCGQPSSMRVVRSRRLPLHAARAAIASNGKATDLCVGGWNREITDVVAALEPMSAKTVQRFDAEARPALRDPEEP